MGKYGSNNSRALRLNDTQNHYTNVVHEFGEDSLVIELLELEERLKEMNNEQDRGADKRGNNQVYGGNW